MGTYPVEVASILHGYLGPFVRQAGTGSGRSSRSSSGSMPRTEYRPDLAFVSYEQWPIESTDSQTQPWEIVPDLAIEVISENDKA